MKNPGNQRKQCLVLLVGDSSEGYELHSEILARAGYAVAGAESGEDAYRQALSLSPDLIVIDLRESRHVDTATRLLRSDARTAQIPTLMLTGRVTSKLYETARSGDTTAFVPVPVTYERLLEEVRRHVPGPEASDDRVLIIEDEQDIRETIAEILEGAGMRVATASDGRQAMDWLRAQKVKPRVILLDLMMPVMDGWTFRAEQLVVPELASIPVVILSAMTDLPRWAGELRVAEYLSKPIDLSQLLSAVERHV
jgi:CheY-like chemotaxis protein